VQSFDIAVVGAGMIGASAALALGEAGRTVALIGPDEPADKARENGPFASHYDEGRITRIVDPDPLWATWAAQSIARYGEIEARSGIAFHVACGSIRAAPEGSPSLEAAKAAAAAHGVVLEDIDGAELSRRLPATGLPDNYAVLWEPAPAGFINPRRMVAALRTVAQQAGATWISGAATTVRANGGSVEITLVDGERLACARALVAVGPHALDTGLLPRLPDLKPFGRTVVQFAIAADDPAYAGLPSFIVGFDPDNENDSFYGVPPVAYPGGGLWLKTGGGAMSDWLTGSDSVRDWFHGGGSADEARTVREMTLRLFPGLADARFRIEPCALVETETAHPFIGRVPGNDAIGIALGCNGYAAKSCIAVGRVAAEMIGGENWLSNPEADALAPRWR
jgi:sarcosine oxidase